MDLCHLVEFLVLSSWALLKTVSGKVTFVNWFVHTRVYCLLPCHLDDELVCVLLLNTLSWEHWSTVSFSGKTRLVGGCWCMASAVLDPLFQAAIWKYSTYDGILEPWSLLIISFPGGCFHIYVYEWMFVRLEFLLELVHACISMLFYTNDSILVLCTLRSTKYLRSHFTLLYYSGHLMTAFQDPFSSSFWKYLGFHLLVHVPPQSIWETCHLLRISPS